MFTSNLNYSTATPQQLIREIMALKKVHRQMQDALRHNIHECQMCLDDSVCLPNLEMARERLAEMLERIS